MATTPAIQHPVLADDTFTVCAISVLAAMLTSVLHEGVGHAVITRNRGEVWLADRDRLVE
jgi:hypothetical protein